MSFARPAACALFCVDSLMSVGRMHSRYRLIASHCPPTSRYGTPASRPACYCGSLSSCAMVHAPLLYHEPARRYALVNATTNFAPGATLRRQAEEGEHDPPTTRGALKPH